ncbi:Fur family transcriptional regulator [Lentilactobacillus sp. SPB1-3]|uniref:Fur family transcriptional regulator n=1 Tax=Lentilactobacillus terminaliae TaxID=3003483 RepID=A0ACD5DG60_9LACO|nr:Fur family transcriptional regulator [Lentilactobacillus sp. SPB1-3]MCZ0976652.1 Fur family transcriptional regulator [Lentilactobacillus sp. SPB1-3]
MIAVEEATKALKNNNYKITKQRMAMIEYLAEIANHKYVEVTAVDEFMRRSFPKMSHNTIYRNISEFEEIGIVEKQVQGQCQSVKFQCDFKNEHHHHFICNQCGKVTELKECPLSDEVLAQLPGTEITGHYFQIYGLCQDCANLKNN